MAVIERPNDLSIYGAAHHNFGLFTMTANYI